MRVPWIDRYPAAAASNPTRAVNDTMFVDDELRDEDDEWNGTRTVSGRVRVEGFRASREQLVRLARAAQIETREKRERYEEIDAWNQGG